MERILIRGEEKDIISELSKYINPDDIKMIIRSLPVFSDLIDDDEDLEISRAGQEPENGMGFVIPKSNYYINLKKTTIAFIGLVLDIRFTEGFTSFILSIFGVAADAIRKLSDMEKCVLFLVKADAVLTGEDEYTLKDSAPCINYARNCNCRQYDRCIITRDMLTNTVQILLEKNLIKQMGNQLVYRF